MIKIIVTIILLLVTISYGKPPIIPDTKKLDAEIKANSLPPLRLKIKGGNVGIVYIVFKKIDSTRMLISDYSSGVPAGRTVTLDLEYDREDVGYAVKILDPRTTPFKLHPLKAKHIVNGENIQDIADAFYLSKKAYELVHYAMQNEFGKKYSMNFEYEAEKKIYYRAYSV